MFEHREGPGDGPERVGPHVEEPSDGPVLLAGPLARAGRELDAALAATDRLALLQQHEIGDRLQELAEVRTRTHRLVVSVALEAVARGVHHDVELSVTDWLRLYFPDIPRRELHDLALVADQCRVPVHAPVRDAVLAGQVSLARAARVLRCLRKVRPVCEGEAYAGHVGNLTGLAAMVEVTDQELEGVTEHLITAALPEPVVEGWEKSRRDLRGVNESSLADGSLTRFVITADPEGAATLRAVLTSPLAAPSPDADGPDPRTPAQRRYDALLTVIGRGVASPEGVPTTAKAKIMVTIPLSSLQGAATIPGSGLTGETLSAGAVRKLACSADLVPAVLGTDSEVLDLGKPVRFATPAQLTVLYRRDKHCTYPGCTVPPQWCDAHHVIWYSRGGKTYLLNLALLCGRHHDLVHAKDLTATVTAFGVTWHLR